WTERRIAELGGRKSLLNPLWYGGALAIGMLAGRFGDRWNLGFLAETERQVEHHLKGHLDTLPPADLRSRAIVEQMKVDEAEHADTAVRLGAHDLPAPAKAVMKAAAQVLTTRSYRLRAVRALVHQVAGTCLTPGQASISSTSWLISAVLASMIEAEQYFSADRCTARCTVSRFRLRPVIV